MQDLIDAARADIRLGTAEGGRVCLTSSFQAECVVLTHLMIQEYPDVPVLFLDTGYHFPETYQYRDEIARIFNLNLVNLAPRQTVAEQESAFGILYQSAPDRCCALRKVEPLFAGLADYDVWFTALRREQSPTRANLQVFENFRLPQGKVLSKVSPLAGWKSSEIWKYLRQNAIPVLPLYELGYTSIGCQPCTIRPADPENLRSGRWAGKQKIECGIHISAGVSH
jgi:phosphoadenosine phosphosulfate reductase